MYINDIYNTVKLGRSYLYADGLKIVFCFKPEVLNESVYQIQSYLNNRTIRSEKWKLSFNLNKCEIMHFGKHLYGLQLYLNKSKIQILISVHDLGISYKGNLKFEQHASFIISKSRRLIGFIMKSFFTTEVKLTLYKIFIPPYIE